ncbi:hypothetical protein XENOCAPTIV_028738, partial [Xenoophorus captivus]
LKGELEEAGEVGDSGEYNVYSTFQSHEPDFDYLKSLEIEEKINKIRWLPQQNAAHFLLSTNGSRSFFSEIISSVSDVKFSHSGRYLLTRDYLTAKVWDLNMDKGPVETYQPRAVLRTRRVYTGGKRRRGDVGVDSLDFTKKILHMAWHPAENIIAIAATNNLYIFQDRVNPDAQTQ